MADFEIITASSSDIQMLQTRSASGSWAGLLQGRNGYSGSLDTVAERGSYSAVAAVFACVRARADSLSIMPTRVGNAQDEIINSGPLADLIHRPNPTMSCRAFWRTTESHLCLFGMTHWHIEALPGGQPVSVKPLNPLAMMPQRDPSNGGLRGWTWTHPDNGRQVFLHASEVHTIIDEDYENPSEQYCGLSPRRVAALAISQVRAADIANQNALQNGMAADGILSVAAGHNLSEEQFRRVKEQVKETYSGLKNRRKWLIAEGGVDFLPITSNYTDMEFVELKKMSRTDICAVFNVPPSVCGYFDDSNYAHADAAEQAFWLRVMILRASWLAEEFERAVVSRFEKDRSLGMTMAIRSPMNIRERMSRNFARAARRNHQRTMYVWFDSSSVPAVQSAMASQAEAATKWAAIGIPVNDFMDAHDIGYARHPWNDTFWRDPFKIDASEDPMSQQNDPAGPSPEDLLDEQTQATQQGVGNKRPRTLLPDTRDLSERQKAAIWLAQRRSYAALESAFRSKTQAHFNALRNEVLRILEREAPKLKTLTKDLIRRDVIGTILFDIFQANNKLAVRVNPLIREAARLGGNQAMQEAADATAAESAKPFAIADPVTQDKIRSRTQNIARVNHTLRRHLADSLAQGVQSNESTAQLADRIRKQFNIANNRARTIAMTEVGAAVEESRQEGRRQAGTPMKSWLWSRKETGRHWHFDTETITSQNPVANESRFIIADTGNEAMAPRLSGAAKDDVNCGCTTLARYPGDSIKVVLDRYTTRGFLTYEQLQTRDAQANQTQDVKPS